MVVLVCAVVAMIGLAFGAYMFLTKTDPGQVLMARMGREANSAALWQVGEERMNNGDLSGAIDYFVKANEQDGKENANVSVSIWRRGARRKRRSCWQSPTRPRA